MNQGGKSAPSLPRVDPAMLGAPSVEQASTREHVQAASSGALVAEDRETTSFASSPPAPRLFESPPVGALPVAPKDIVIAAAEVRDPLSQTAANSPGRTPPAMSPRVRKLADDERSWYERLWAPIANAYHNGSLELYLPLETYHLRSKYEADKIATYQEKPKGLGIGSGLYNEKGNWEGVYAMAFQDSHFKPMYMAGYGWQAIWRPVEDTRVGLGYVAGLMSRTDVWGYKPFPVALPFGSIAYRNFSLNGLFIPGGRGWGNVAFFWAKWEFGKEGERIGTPAKPPPVAETDLASGAMGPFVPPERRRLPYGPVVATGGAPLAQPSAGALHVAGDRPAGSPPGGLSPAIVSSTAGYAAAQTKPDEKVIADSTPALALHSTRSMVPLPKESPAPRPVFLNAQRMGGDIDREFNAEGDAELRKIGTVLNADRMTYWPVEDEVEAEGNVRLQQEKNVVTGPKMRLKLEDQVGFFEEPEFHFKRGPLPGSQAAADKDFAERYLEQRSQGYWEGGFAMPLVTQNIYAMRSLGRTMSDGRGEAERVDFEGENQYRLSNSIFTTCAPGDNDWYVKSKELKLDYDYERGEGREATLYFKDVPIFYSPWMSFSLNGQRKSGVLAPSFGATSNNGLTLSVPYYWNIAPNRDATITTRILSKRGMQLDTQVRYLDRALGGAYEGEGRFEFLPSDKQMNGNNRYGLALTHRQWTSSGFVGQLNFNRVSDNTYFTDLTSYIGATSQTQLLQQGMLGYYGGGWWNATANFQGYQTLQPDPNNPVLEPYRMLPQITVNARKPDLYMTDSSFMGQFTAFTRPQQIINGVPTADPNGRRLVLYPQVALPYVTPGWYVTPKVGLNIRHYSLSGQSEGLSRSVSTTLPVFSVDSGMTFERSDRWFGKEYLQTLEPRLYYVNIPYKNQDAIPIFDTALADFNFAQIFSENQFSSWDRVNNANQLTAAVTSRLLEPKSGAEIMRAMLGQRFYFSRNKVGLSANTIASADERNWDKSDFLAAFSGQVLPRVYTDLASQYNFSDKQLKRLSLGVRYLPEPGKVLNAAYRYYRDASAPTNQIDLSGQWPLTGRLYAVGRYNYSLKDTGTTLSTGSQSGRLIQAVAGLEYKGGCWVVRGVIQRLALTASAASSAFFIQLELNDFASIGSNPISMLRRNIQGYGLINEPTTDFDYVR